MYKGILLIKRNLKKTKYIFNNKGGLNKFLYIQIVEFYATTKKYFQRIYNTILCLFLRLSLNKRMQYPKLCKSFNI